MADAPSTAPVTTPAPEPAAPAGAPSGTPEAGGQPSSGEGTSAQPGKTAEPAQPKEPQFPWSDYRKAQQEKQRYAAELQRAQETLKAQESERTKWQTEQQTLSQRAKDYDALADVLRKNPDLADALEARINAGGTRTAATATGLPKEFLDEFKAMRDQVAQLSSGYTKQQELAHLAQQRAEMERTGQELQTGIKAFLKEHNYSEKLAPHAEAFVLEWVRKNGGAEMNEVPLILNEWYAAQEENFRARMDSLRTASEPGKGLPPVPGGGAQAPINGKPDFGALDGKTSRVLEAELRNRLGWGKEGAA
jgi:hypothetical protein